MNNLCKLAKRLLRTQCIRRLLTKFWLSIITWPLRNLWSNATTRWINKQWQWTSLILQTNKRTIQMTKSRNRRLKLQTNSSKWRKTRWLDVLSKNPRNTKSNLPNSLRKKKRWSPKQWRCLEKKRRQESSVWTSSRKNKSKLLKSLQQNTSRNTPKSKWLSLKLSKKLSNTKKKNSSRNLKKFRSKTSPCLQLVALVVDCQPSERKEVHSKSMLLTWTRRRESLTGLLTLISLPHLCKRMTAAWQKSWKLRENRLKLLLIPKRSSQQVKSQSRQGKLAFRLNVTSYASIRRSRWLKSCKNLTLRQTTRTLCSKSSSKWTARPLSQHQRTLRWRSADRSSRASRPRSRTPTAWAWAERVEVSLMISRHLRSEYFLIISKKY